MYCDDKRWIVGVHANVINTRSAINRNLHNYESQPQNEYV